MQFDPARLTKKPMYATCEACVKWKKCHMYLTQMGTADWVCDECRSGKKK